MKKVFLSIDDVIDFAQEAEEDAADLYLTLAKLAKTTDLKRLYRESAKEESHHAEMIATLRGRSGFILPDHIKNTLSKEFEPLVKLNKTYLTYEDALLIAINKEKAAYRMYIKLAELSTEDDIQNLFLILAHQELGHQNDFEVKLKKHQENELIISGDIDWDESENS